MAAPTKQEILDTVLATLDGLVQQGASMADEHMILIYITVMFGKAGELSLETQQQMVKDMYEQGGNPFIPEQK
jgi:hypothetical protein